MSDFANQTTIKSAVCNELEESDERNTCERVINVKRNKFSCWNVIDPKWLNSAEQLSEDRIYVHGEILEWIVEYIDEHILNRILRANVEEVHHHNLDGPVYLIKFYKHKPKSKRFGMMTISEESNTVAAIKGEMEYKMPWKKNPTYFLRMDSDFEVRKIRIMNRFRELNLLDCFSATPLDVNWLYIPKIEIYEFSNDLPEDRLDLIDSIFQEMSKSGVSIYICDQFQWHQNVDYVDVDEVAMDVCAEEWSRYDLLKQFSIEDILGLDLANKDYRDPYYNEYLDRYLNRLLEKALPQLSANNDEKFEFPLYQLDPTLRHYFVSRFYKKISTLCDDHGGFAHQLNTYDIKIIDRFSSTVDLIGDQPPPETPLLIECHSVKYKISGYTHFSDSLFRALLNKSNEYQWYNIRFDKEFRFIYESDQQFSPHLTDDCNWTLGYKYIVIELKHCSERNADKLRDFVQYLIKLFATRKKLDVKVSMRFIKCMLEDYSFLRNIGNGIDDVKFEGMNISSQQIKILSCALNQQRKVIFTDCKEITDNNVMTLLENIELDNLWIEGVNACSAAIYYLMAEHLMNKEGVDSIKANRFNDSMRDCKYNFAYDFDLIEFFKEDNQIVARNRYSNETLDLYYLLNGIKEDDSIDSFNTMYME